jgi:hypothetical protein
MKSIEETVQNLVTKTNDYYSIKNDLIIHNELSIDYLYKIIHNYPDLLAYDMDFTKESNIDEFIKVINIKIDELIGTLKSILGDQFSYNTLCDKPEDIQLIISALQNSINLNKQNTNKQDVKFAKTKPIGKITLKMNIYDKKELSLTNSYLRHINDIVERYVDRDLSLITQEL